MIKRLIKYIITKFPNKSQKFAYKILYRDQRNVNLDLTNPNQKRALISYITLTGFDFDKIQHASFYHLNQIIHYFIKQDFCIDICRLDDMGAYERMKHNKYDVILGFGPVYKAFCKNFDIPIRICFLMENNPVVVEKKYAARIKYFYKRHPNISLRHSVPRIGYFDVDTFKLSTSMILMNSAYNSQSLYQHIPDIHRINSNAIFNVDFEFDKQKISQFIESSRNNILWFGSLGIIHKGLDILIDTIAKNPNMILNCYGVDQREYSLFKKLKAYNTVDCKRVNVLSEDFVTEIVHKHNIVVLPSCSEGMSTAIATCMAHGLIPIVTKDCGFDECQYIIQIEECTIESLEIAINRIQKMSNDEILEMRYQCYQYARENFSIQTFDNRFSNIMDTLLVK